MIKTLLLNTLLISAVTGVIASAVLIFRGAMAKGKGRRVASKWLCLCWTVLAMRLLIPFNAPVRIASVNVPTELSAIGAYDISDDTAFEEVQTEKEEITPQAKAPKVDLLNALAVLWLIGAGVFMASQITAYLMMKKRLFRYSRAAEEGVINAAKEIAAANGINRKIRVLECEEKVPPMLMGIFKPILLLPKGISGEQLAPVLSHEITHMKRHDILFKCLVTAARSVHWFNPIVHLMAVTADKDAEAACDEAVLLNADKKQRRVYCDTILNMMSGRRIPFATALAYKKEDIMRRFVNIFDTTKRKSGIVLVLALCLCVVLGSMVGCAEKKPAASDSDVEEIIEVNNSVDWFPEYTEIKGEPKEKAMELINDIRAKNGLDELNTDNEALDALAKLRAEEIQTRFDHTRPNNSEWKTIFDENNVRYSIICENLARGQSDAKQAVSQWLDSQSHKDNILNEYITDMSIACVLGDDGMTYWVFIGFAE